MYSNLKFYKKMIFIFIRKQVNKTKITQKCIYTNCTRYATYNNPGEKKRIYCSEHKKENMVDVAHKRCIYEGCNAQPTYNKPGEKRDCIVKTINQKG